MLARPANLPMLQPAVDARLVGLADGGLRFRHPLARSAIYQEATIAQRTTVHEALTNVLAGQPDRRAWHRAAATAGRDDEVAAEVEQMAARMQARGASLQAAIAYGRAARLSEAPDGRARRLLRGGELAFDAGRADLVREFVSEARELALDDHQRARAEWLSEIFYDGEPGDPHRVMALVDVAERAAFEGDEELGLTRHLRAGGANRAKRRGERGTPASPAERRHRS